MRRADLDLARSEGVLGLLAENVLARGEVPPEIAGPLREGRRALAARSLKLQLAWRDVLATLEAARVDVLVLKGAALGHWLYPSPWLREVSDLDLLFRSRQHAAVATDTLRDLGYRVACEPGRFSNEMSCRRLEQRVDLDLHWSLSAHPALGSLPGFDALQEHSIPLPTLAPGARGLGPVDALWHACVHRATNLSVPGVGDGLKSLLDVHRLASSLRETGWREFAHVCRAARISGIAVNALEASQTLFGTPLPEVVVDQLHAASAHDVLDARRLREWRYMKRSALRALPGIRERMAWLHELAVPPAPVLQMLHGESLSHKRLVWRHWGVLCRRALLSAVDR